MSAFANRSRAVPTSKVSGKRWLNIRKNWVLYLFLLPCVTYVLIFNYLPLYGIQIAFKDFSSYKGIWESPVVGFKHFIRFFGSFQFWDLLRNTLTLSLYVLIATFPMPIILALLLNYTTINKMKKFAQTVTYAPHLISTVVMVGILMVFLEPRGMINQLTHLFYIHPKVYIGISSIFQSIYVWSDVWQKTGWSSIIYIAVLAGISPELHEAAVVDGANKLQRIWHIDLVALMPTAVILLIMNLGSIMNIGFEKVFLMQNSLNMGVSEIISTYVYKIGIQRAQFSYATAIGLFNNVINFVLLIIVNHTARTLTGNSLW